MLKVFRVNVKVKINNILLNTKPPWFYGIQIWDSAKHFNFKIIQPFQFIFFRQIVSAPWFTKYTNLHNDLKILTQLTKLAYFNPFKGNGPSKSTNKSILTPPQNYL